MHAESELEHRFLECLRENGWEIKNGADVIRESYDEPLLTSNLKAGLRRLNPGIAEEDITRVINELRTFPSTPEGSKKTLDYIKNGVSISDSKRKNLRKVIFIDYNDIAAPAGKRVNEYIAVNQAIYKNSRIQIRTDIILYINGIPVANIELKDPDNLRKSWQDAYRDIIDYENKVPELYKYAQIGAAGDSNFKYFATVHWDTDTQKMNEWKQDSLSPMEAICSMFCPEKLLNILKYYLFFREEQNAQSKIIARYMQYRASERIVSRVKTGLIGEEEKSKGLIWHWQGSGKTFTMIFAANKIYQMPEASNPTVFFIVDRDELETQLFDEFNYLSLFAGIKTVTSVNKMKEIISHDNFSGQRGIFVTLIHKFRREELAHLNEYFDEMEKEAKRQGNLEALMTGRKNIISFIDEGHRSQYGLMAGQMKRILKSGFAFAFTGTPISKENRDTYAEFGYDDEPYLDKYFMKDSIDDGFTKKIAYQARLSSDVHLTKEEVKIFYESDDEELTDTVKKKIEDKVKKRIGKKVLFFENPDRIKLIAKDIAGHYNSNLEGRFKALVVTATRKACEMYRSELLKYFKEDEIETVMTSGPKEKEPEVEKHYYRIKEKYGEDSNIAKDTIINNFKKKDKPKILIVTDMLVTGFDAPVLQTLYLDKPIKEHRLLQTIARTNRPYKEKQAGLVIDYVGVLDDIKSALKSYLEARDEKVLFKMEDMEKEFTETIDSAVETAVKSGIKKGETERQSLVKVLKYLSEKEERLDKFVELCKKAARLYELLGNSGVKLRKVEDFKWISAIYIFYRKSLSEDASENYYIEKYFKRTVEDIYSKLDIKDFIQTPEIYFDSKSIDKMLDKINNTEIEAANIVFALRRYILVAKSYNPVYLDLVEKIKQILMQWQEAGADYADIIRKGKGIFEEKAVIENEQKQLNLPDYEYAMYRSLLKMKLKKQDALKAVKEIKQEIMENGEYLLENVTKPEVSKAVSRIIRRYLRKQGYGFTPADLDKSTNWLLNDIIGAGYAKENKD